MPPLADRLRPETIADVVGQQHILAEGRVLRRIIESGNIPNLIFYGPSGVGKTTVARIISQMSGKRLHKLNGTTASTADIKAVVADSHSIGADSGVILYLDEIQYLNKKQQQTLLEFIEDGSITLIASTTENPYFYIYNAILSRSSVFEFKQIPNTEVEKAVRRAIAFVEEEKAVKFEVADETIAQIAYLSGGDVRKSINSAEILMIAAMVSGGNKITPDDVADAMQKTANRYDKAGDEQYDLMSALQKSIRGSDENAAVYYLARMLEAGDLIAPCRRLLVIASEDIGLAYPMAAVIVKACVDSAFQLGLPEAQIPLAQAAILLATAPKSNSAINAIGAAMADVKAGTGRTMPRTLQNKHFDGIGNEVMGQNYQYPHDFPNHYLKQQYLPDELRGRIYYEYGDNKTEQAAKQYWDKIKGEK